jgi:hypothetical protein
MRTATAKLISVRAERPQGTELTDWAVISPLSNTDVLERDSLRSSQKSVWSCVVSAIDSELKTGKPAIAEPGWQAMILWCSALFGLMVGSAGLFAYIVSLRPAILPSEWWAVLGLVVLFLSTAGLLDRHDVVNLRLRGPSQRMQVRSRIETYYKRGHDLYLRLANDSTIAPDETRRLVADEWVNPVTEYLRGTLGERKASYFLSVAQGLEPDNESVVRFGYQKALARERLIQRLERLREIAASV